MIPPESLVEAAADALTGGSLSADQLHRHLVARVAAAREQLRALEARRPEPAVLMTRVGATVAEAQRLIEVERAQADVRSDALGRVAARRGRELVAEAEAEARILRAVATWLRQVPAGVFVPDPVAAEAPVDAPVEQDQPVLAAIEARAS